MTDRIDLLKEANRRGLLQGDQKRLYDEAVTRGLIKEDGLMDRAMGAVERAGGRIKDLYEGDKTREFDYPELPQTIWKDGGVFPIQDRLAQARDVQGKADILAENMPDAVLEFDKYLNPYVRIDKQNFYLNRPGASVQDANELIQEGAYMAMGGRFGGGPFKALLPRAVGTGIGTGAGSLAQDMGAQAAGSKTAPDLGRAGLSAALGFGFEAASPVVLKALKAVFVSPVMWAKGRLTPRGEEAVRSLGIDPAQVTDEVARRFGAMADDAVSPATTMRYAEADAMGVPLTRGDATQDMAQQAFEEAAMRGARGDQARAVMQGFRHEVQNPAVQAAKDRTQAAVGGVERPLVTEEGQGAKVAADAMRAQEAASKAGVGRAYREAADLNASLPGDAVSRLRAAILDDMEQSVNLEIAPTARAVLADFDRILTATVRPGDKAAQIGLKRLEQFRQRLNAALPKRGNSSMAPADERALLRIKARFDETLDDFVDDALFTGEKEALDALKKARGLAREHFAKFKDDDIIRKLIDAGVDEAEALNYLFGAAALGKGQTKIATVKALRKMKQILGEDSPAYSALREEGFLRLLRTSQKRAPRDPNGNPIFNGNAFANAFDDAMQEAPALMRELYGNQLLGRMRTFRNVVWTVSNKQPGAVNTSNTAYELVRTIQQAVGGTRIIELLARTMAGKFINVGNLMKANSALVRESPGLPGPRGMYGAAGATAGN